MDVMFVPAGTKRNINSPTRAPGDDDDFTIWTDDVSIVAYPSRCLHEDSAFMRSFKMNIKGKLFTGSCLAYVYGFIKI